ncbi:hypothetical protein [Cyanobium sp. Lug-B]|uniref:hypothetical protein n=1 Tax=Cyanobium sp. Lug-B TaxID=2823716 RepID=UPI0020CEBC27|nr:hypothetical protein [Cyanobium sp. Lug-B]MCP9796122.1 hypothetical protein [Cyanobium sp. Lug-B]
MAKRFTISLPDELAQRIEPFKDQLSLSAIMQKSLEAELAELLSPKEDKTKATALLERAKAFYREDFAVLVKAAQDLVDHLIDKAIQDHDMLVFKLYCHLQLNEVKDIEPQELMDCLCDTCLGTENKGPIFDDQTCSVFSHSIWANRESLDEDFPDVRPWDDADLMRIIKIVLDEKLGSLLGEDALKTYLVWGTGYPTLEQREASRSSKNPQRGFDENRG